MASLLRRPSSRLSLSFSLLSRHLSPLPSPPPLPTTSHLFSTSPSPPLNPTQLYLSLSSSSSSPTHNPQLSKSLWDKLTILFRSFSKSPWAIDQALSLYLPSSAFPSAVSKFRLFFLSNCSPQTAEQLLEMAEEESESAVHRFLFPVFAEFCLKELQSDLKKFKQLMETADLTKPHTWYPFARAMKRKIIYHCGPTNSGKTYNALCRFMEAKSGVYCSPLRLLAMEVFDKVNSLGVYCSLHTGQEKEDVPFANHVACTIEMVSTDELYEVAVIDEVQMMADPTRGFAWTRALLGLKADEIHLCGDPSVLSVVQNICHDTGDDLQINRYDRFKPLVVEAKTLLGDLRNVRSGDCVVAFSRREIFEVKLAIEKSTKHKCCVIYGALPPETRRQQASLFNDQENEYDILVASDAVGMGLNLNIRRVVFYSLSKFNGNKMVPVEPTQVKQIAGRAGRRGSVYPDGLVTTFSLDDLNYLIECLQKPFQQVKKVGLFPCFEQFELFAGQFPEMPFNELLDKFRENSRIDQSFFFCKNDGVKKVANMLERVPNLTLKERYSFCFAPVNIRDPKAMYHLLRFATYYSQKKPVSIAMGMPRGSAKNDAELLDLETKHQVLSAYLWLSHHFEESDFPHVEKAENMAAGIAELLGKSLARVYWKPQSRQQISRNKKNEAGEEDRQEKEDSSIEDDRRGYQRPISFVKESMM
ncbi:ATP-dependent RNA helicase SUV3L, mitochondrial-like isoform X2 [Carex rostrata]